MSNQMSQMTMMTIMIMFIIVMMTIATVNAYSVVIPRSMISSSTTTMIPRRTSLLSLSQQQQNQKQFSSLMMMHMNNDNEDRSTNNNDNDEDISMSLATASSNHNNHGMAIMNGIITSLVLSSPAFADSPDWGLFEGRTGSLLHPVVMSGLFLATLYTGYLGLQYKRQRTIGDEISTLKKSLPVLQEDQEKTGNYLLIEQQITSLQDERKSLIALGPRDKHFSQGALLAFIGTSGAIEGCLNTYSRAGKLFPGPHLFAGAALVICWGLAVATVPSMIKGNDISRKIHVGSNIIGTSLFGWQVITGLPILLKVYEKTSWP